jgi:hypothetical protein
VPALVVARQNVMLLVVDELAVFYVKCPGFEWCDHHAPLRNTIAAEVAGVNSEGLPGCRQEYFSQNFSPAKLPQKNV